MEKVKVFSKISAKKSEPAKMADSDAGLRPSAGAV